MDKAMQKGKFKYFNQIIKPDKKQYNKKEVIDFLEIQHGKYLARLMKITIYYIEFSR